MLRSISSDSRPIACFTPSSPATAAADSIGRPTKTKDAPRASAFSTSLPRRMPPSYITVMPPASRAISARLRRPEIVPSNCRPPWLDTMMPSAPASRHMRASSGEMMPFTTSLPFQRRRISSRCSHAKPSRAPKARISVLETMGGPRPASIFSKCGMPFVSMVLKKVFSTQPGWVMPSHSNCGVGFSGME